MAELEQALELIRTHSDQAHFVGPRDPELVSAAEAALGLQLPPTLRRFVTELGAGSFSAEEFYGVIQADFTHSGVPDGIWLTLLHRKEWGLPKELIVVCTTGMGDDYVLDTSVRNGDGESPVCLWLRDPSDEPGALEVIAADFGSFLLDMVREQEG